MSERSLSWQTRKRLSVLLAALLMVYMGYVAYKLRLVPQLWTAGVTVLAGLLVGVVGTERFYAGLARAFKAGVLAYVLTVVVFVVFDVYLTGAYNLFVVDVDWGGRSMQGVVSQVYVYSVYELVATIPVMFFDLLGPLVGMPIGWELLRTIRGD